MLFPGEDSIINNIFSPYFWDNIQTKDDFKKFLFDFHNIINKRKRFKIEDISIINNYKQANFKNIILKFREVFQTKIPQLMTDQMHRRHIVNKIINSIGNNQHIFLH